MKELQQTQLAMKEVTNIASIKRQHEKLVEAGMGNTANAKVLESIIGDSERYERAQKFLQDCKTYKDDFPHSFIVSTEQFDKVIKDYHLAVDTLNHFTGVIPTDKADYLLHCRDMFFGPNCYGFNKGLFRISELSIDSAINKKDYKKEIQALETWCKTHMIIEVGSDRMYRDTVFYTEIERFQSDLPEVVEKHRKGYYDFKGSTVHGADLLIAAPKECFMEDFRVTERPIDPIVFQKCNYGYIVHAVWGDEADSEVLKRYKEFANNL